MKKTMLWMCSAFASLTVSGGLLSDETQFRFGPMPKAPVIDGKIGYGEWNYACTTFGGISPKSKLMTRRQNDFRIGYDAKNIYFSITSEIPLPPQAMNGEDMLEFQLQAPGKKKPTIIKFDYSGKGSVPAGVKIRSSIGISLMNAEQGKCWIAEISVPYSVFGVKGLKDGEKWGLQMIRHWSSVKESGYLHLPRKAGEMATFIPDSKAPVVSFDGFGLHMYPATGCYNWTYRMENATGKPIRLFSECYRVGVDGAATLDIRNPDLFGKESKVKIGHSATIQNGKTARFELLLMSQFPGKPRLLHSLIRDKAGTVFYKRDMFWDVRLSQKIAIYKDELGLPYLNAGFYPSFGNKLRVAATFNKKMPIGYVEINVKDSKGKILHSFKRSNFGNPMEDFEDQTVLKNLPLGDYSVVMESQALNGKKFSHTRTFSIRKFAWQGLNLGKERIIVPPFKPLKNDVRKQEVHALLTGYKIGGGLWSSIYAENENILAAPIQFVLNGKAISSGKTKLISAEKDLVIYETTLTEGKVKFVLKQEYEYDGFCKLTTQVIPQGKVKVDTFALRIPLKSSVAKYYAGLDTTRPRGQGKGNAILPTNQGVLRLEHLRRKNGCIHNYFWFGDLYKGFSFINDSRRGYSLNKKIDSYEVIRTPEAVTFMQYIVNKPTTWEKPWSFVIGFSPTPVKPINQKFRSLSQWMFSYKTAKGSDKCNMGIYQLPLGEYYNIAQEPDGCTDYYDFVMKHRNKIPTKAEMNKAADDYLKRHGEWLRKNAPLTPESYIRRIFTKVRSFGDKYMLIYNDPAHFSYRWPEAEMYKAEWLPFDYPVDDAMNEYTACQTSEYIDKMLYDLRKFARLGIEGMNFDCFALGGGNSTVSGGAFREAPGKVPLLHNHNMLQIAAPGIASARNLFGWRELLKRTAHMLYTEGRMVHGVPWVELHTTNSTVPSVAAFCATTITTECGGNGGNYFDRFPEGYVLGDMAGTQAGVMPRPIVSTKSGKISTDEQVRSLISFSFAYGFMTHCDQGVSSGYRDFEVARDEVFTFGFGRPQNKTITFYDKEKQPITCNAKDIRTTQVIRPDGKAMLMVGNLGGKVKAKFDLSGLNYKKYKITDVFTGKVLPKAEIDVQKHGYALLKIEEIK